MPPYRDAGARLLERPCITPVGPRGRQRPATGANARSITRTRSISCGRTCQSTDQTPAAASR